MAEAVDCCDPEHWFDNDVGRPGGHDGGLPEYPRTPCVSFFDAEARSLLPEDRR